MLIVLESNNKFTLFFFLDKCVRGITDGYYISNQNNKLRTFKIQEGISIELIRTLDDVYNLDEKKVGDEFQIRTYIEKENLIILHIEEGIVIRIEEQFIP